MHQHIDEEESGSCPICRMNLVPTTRELEWFCADRPELTSNVAGECPDGTKMELRSIAMAHGDHNPKHGGILFMAPNGFHHIEGTLDEAGEFRLYVYNDFTKPIDATGFDARVGDQELLSVSDSAILSANIGRPDSYPAELVVHVRFPDSHEDEARFDFIFAGETVGAADEATTIILPEFRIPDNADDIFAAILDRDARVRDLIARGVWPDLYIPALEAKDLVLALHEKESALIRAPAKKLVRAAWLLDVYGDMGNRLEVEEAYRLFEASIRELEAARAQ